MDFNLPDIQNRFNIASGDRRTRGDDQALNDIPELADISRPRMSLQGLYCPLGKDWRNAIHGAGLKLCKVMDKRFDLPNAFPKRGNMERDSIQPVKEIRAKALLADSFLQVHIGGSNDPEADFYRTAIANPFEAPVLQHV